MSTYLITVAPEDSFVHQVGTLLATEFEVTHQKLEVSIEQLKMAIGIISPDDSDSIGVLKTLLCEAGLNANFLVKHQNCVVLSDDIVPIDLISINNEDIGRQISISHIVSNNISGLVALGRKGLEQKQIYLERAIFLPITELPPLFPRISQDLIKSALKLSSKISVDILLNPSVHLSLSQFNRQDAQILHVDSHATLTGIQLAPSSKLSKLVDFQLPISVPVVLLMACSTVKNYDSIGQKLLEHGALTVVGAFFDWLTGSFTGDISSPDMYDAFCDSLLSGETVGNALVAAKRKSINNFQNAGLLLLGNQFLKFTPRT